MQIMQITRTHSAKKPKAAKKYLQKKLHILKYITSYNWSGQLTQNINHFLQNARRF